MVTLGSPAILKVRILDVPSLSYGRYGAVMCVVALRNPIDSPATFWLYTKGDET